MQADIRRDAGKLSFEVKNLAAKVKSAPGLGKPFKTVEPVDDSVSDARSHEPDRAAGEHAKLKIVPIIFASVSEWSISSR